MGGGVIEVRGKSYPKLTVKDYYRRNADFRHYLLHHKNMYLGAMKTTKAKKMFMKFADKYNDGLLEDKYYEGISLLSLDAAERTGHKWKLKLSRGEKEDLLNAK